MKAARRKQQPPKSTKTKDDAERDREIERLRAELHKVANIEKAAHFEIERLTEERDQLKQKIAELFEVLKLRKRD